MKAVVTFPMCTNEIWKRGATTRRCTRFPNTQKNRAKFVQKVTGKSLYLGRVIYITLLAPLLAIASQQAAPTQRTMQHTKQLLDYIASQEDAVLTYHASDMILAAHSDAGYYVQ